MAMLLNSHTMFQHLHTAAMTVIFSHRGSRPARRYIKKHYYVQRRYSITEGYYVQQLTQFPQHPDYFTLCVNEHTRQCVGAEPTSFFFV